MNTSLLSKRFICFLRWGLFMSLPFTIACHASETISLEVTAGNEILIGQYADPTRKVAAFKGIPYAASPVNQRRWQAPEKPQPRPGNSWQRTLLTLAFKTTTILNGIKK